MSWEKSIVSVMGECTSVENSDLANVVFTTTNGFRWVYGSSMWEISWNKSSKDIGYNDIVNNMTYTLFAFPLKNKSDGTNANKYLCCRAYFYNKNDSALYLYNTVVWSLYDIETMSYTDISVTSGGVGLGGANSIEHICHIIFHVQTETFNNVEQKIIYGGVAHTVKYSGTDTFAIGLQGIATETQLSNYIVNVEEVEFSPEYGGGSIPDGYSGGSFDDTSDTISIDAKPQVGVTTAGFINVYKITQGDLNTLGEKLFPHFLPAELLADPSQISVPEMLAVMLKSFYGTLISPVGSAVQLADNLGIIDILMNGKLIDYVIDCHIIPCSISGATVEGLKVGYRQFNDLQLARATEDYVDIDCGSLSILEYFANFLDFCTCTAELYLPFVGFVPVDSEYWNGGTIQVKYRFNIIDGSFQCFVLSTSGKSNLSQSIIAQYGGVACVHLPITGLQYSNVIAGLVNGSTGAVANGSGGNMAGVVNNLANMAMLRPDNPMSNGYNASSSFLGKRTPYLLIKRPKAQFSTRYNKEMGLPLNVSKQLSTVHGFTVIDNPVLNITCSDKEYNELVSLMKSGIIL